MNYRDGILATLAHRSGLLRLVLTGLIGLFAVQGHAAPGARLRLLSRVNDGPPTERASVDLKAGERCRLSVVVEEGEGQARRYTSDFAGAARLADGKEVSVEVSPAAQSTTAAAQSPAGVVVVRWFKIEPQMQHTPGHGHDPTVPDFLWYTNAYCPSSPKHQQWLGYDKIEYARNEVAAAVNQWTITADAHPTDRGQDVTDGLGVMRYAAEVTLGGRTLHTPGVEAAEELGIADRVFRLAVRRDDSYIGYATSYFNVPGVFGSDSPQVDRYLGVDCADLVVGAWRKWKKSKQVGYTNVNGLIPIMKPVGGAFFIGEKEGVFADKGLSRPARVPFKEGAAVLFDYPGTVEEHYDHVGLLYRDNGNGIVDGEDIFLQAGPMAPRLDPLKSQVIPKSGPTRVRVLEWQ